MIHSLFTYRSSSSTESTIRPAKATRRVRRRSEASASDKALRTRARNLIIVAVICLRSKNEICETSGASLPSSSNRERVGYAVVTDPTDSKNDQNFYQS